MTTATLRLFSITSWTDQLLHYIADMVEGVIEARQIAIRYERLVRMSNTELRGLGLSRADIPSAAVNGVAGL